GGWPTTTTRSCGCCASSAGRRKRPLDGVSQETLLRAAEGDSTMTIPEPSSRRSDGSTIVRRKGVALFRFQEFVGGADVIVGEEGDATLLGALSLEALGLSLDPIRRELKPMTLIL